MKSILIVISSDPRTSARPAEAVRMAAGLSAWKKFDVSLCLRGPATFVLQSEGESLIDEDHFARYLPMAAENGSAIYVQGNFPSNSVATRIISDSELAELCAKQSTVFRF